MDIEARVARLEQDATATSMALLLLASALTPEEKAALHVRAGNVMSKAQWALEGREGTELAVRRLIDHLFA